MDESSTPTNRFPRVVALGASAGGLEALHAVLAALPADLPAAVLIVQHLDPHHISLLPEILGRRTPLAVKKAEDGDALRAGTVYVAPPDRHLLVCADATLALSADPVVHHVRPSADRLFESLATNLGDRAVAVVLTGTGQDGAAGLAAVKAAGGRTIAQDPETASYPNMPRAAIRTNFVDDVLPLDQIAGKLIELTAPPAGDAP
jgi:two-component system chemotaxis response regulator CheB